MSDNNLDYACGWVPVEPVGTITIYLPFLNEKDRERVIVLMTEASRYDHFVRMLCEEVVANPTSCELAFLTRIHLEYVSDENLFGRFYEAHNETEFLRPFVLRRTNNDFDWETLAYAAEDELEKNPPSWIQFELLIFIHYLAVTNDLGGPIEHAAKERMASLLDENPKLGCFKSYYYNQLRCRERFQGQMNEAMKYCRKSLKLAKKYNDRIREAGDIFMHADALLVFGNECEDEQEIHYYLNKATSIFRELGLKNGLASVLSALHVHSFKRAEFNESLRCNLQRFEFEQELGKFNTLTARATAGAYEEVGRIKDALEWMHIALESVTQASRLRPILEIDLAQTLIAKGSLSEAWQYISSGLEGILASGEEMSLGNYYLALGHYERKMGDYESAMDSFTQSYEIALHYNRIPRIRFAVQALAETEVQMLVPTPENMSTPYSGKWMKQFEEMVYDKGMPGYDGIFLLLEARLRIKQSRFEEAERIIDKVMDLSKIDRIEYLGDRALLLLEELALVRDQMQEY
ncbi:MAG: hypothetical protein ACFFAY_01695 [Promethearchaeota archaeon]